MSQALRPGCGTNPERHCGALLLRALRLAIHQQQQVFLSSDRGSEAAFRRQQGNQQIEPPEQTLPIHIQTALSVSRCVSARAGPPITAEVGFSPLSLGRKDSFAALRQMAASLPVTRRRAFAPRQLRCGTCDAVTSSRGGAAAVAVRLCARLTHSRLQNLAARLSIGTAADRRAPSILPLCYEP